MPEQKRLEEQPKASRPAVNEMTRIPVSRRVLRWRRFGQRCYLRFCLETAFLLALYGGYGWSQPLVITRVTVIDATGRGPAPNMTVTVDGDRIVAVGPWKKMPIPKNAVVVDGAGKFLIPGLWDMHAHGAADEHAAWTHLLFLGNGVVGVRDMFGPPDAHAWRTARVSKEDPSPAIYLGSPLVDGPNPRWPHSIVVTSEAQGREVVEQQQQRGADFIKVYDNLSRGAYFAIADEAKKRGIPFEGHVPKSVTAAEVSAAGQKSIEHLTGVALGCTKEELTISAELQRQEALFHAPNATMSQKMDSGKRMTALYLRVVETYDDAQAQSLFTGFVKNGTWQCPTLTLLRAYVGDPLPANDPRVTYLSKELRAEFDAGFYQHFPAEARAWTVSLRKKEFDESMKIVGLMYRMGVPMLAGTDALNPHCFPGFSIHDELALLVDAGLPPLAALQAATRNAAQFMGQLDRRGTIEPGKIADLVLLDKDPLADIHNTRTIQAVVLNGKLFPRAALDGMLTKEQMLAGRENDGVTRK
ncbi:MAG: amidohydrolase family protein [Bryobacteraceae bacterium]|jgi:imidazolonepropionase-like amidohydrolase